MADVLVGVDGSVSSVLAAHWAAAEAARRGTGLRLVAGCYHLGRMPESGEEYAATEAKATAVLASVAAEEVERFPEVEVRFEAVPHWPVGALLAAQEDAELLVVGSRGLGGFRGLLLGSTSLAVAGASSCPVVVVRPEAAVTGHLSTGGSVDEQPPVVVGVDTRDPDPAVLEFAVQAAEERDAALYAVAVAPWPQPWRPVPHGRRGEEGRAELVTCEEQALAKALSEVRAGARVGVLGLVRAGHPAERLVEEAQDAALLVLGRRRRGAAGTAGLGSTAHAVLHHALSPVAVVPHS